MYLLCDIGGSKIRISFSDGKNIGEPKSAQTPQDFSEAVSLIKKLAEEVSLGKQPEKAIFGLPGPLNSQKDALLNAPNLPLWVNKPIKSELESALNTQVFLENDAALVGIGEALEGAGKGFRIVAYITVSTGVGGSRIIDGKIDSNSLGFEPGHQIIREDATTLEQLVSGSALEKIYGKSPDEITDQSVWDEVIKNLSIGLNNTIVHWSPDIVVIGGGIGRAIDLDKLNARVKQTVKIFPNPPEIVGAKLGDDAGLYGGLHILEST